MLTRFVVHNVHILLWERNLDVVGVECVVCTFQNATAINGLSQHGHPRYNLERHGTVGQFFHHHRHTAGDVNARQLENVLLQELSHLFEVVAIGHAH